MKIRIFLARLSVLLGLILYTLFGLVLFFVFGFLTLLNYNDAIAAEVCWSPAQEPYQFRILIVVLGLTLLYWVGLVIATRLLKAAADDRKIFSLAETAAWILIGVFVLSIFRNLGPFLCVLSLILSLFLLVCQFIGNGYFRDASVYRILLRYVRKAEGEEKQAVLKEMAGLLYREKKQVRGSLPMRYLSDATPEVLKKAALHDSDPDVRRKAQEILEKIFGEGGCDLSGEEKTAESLIRRFENLMKGHEEGEIRDAADEILWLHRNMPGSRPAEVQGIRVLDETHEDGYSSYNGWWEDGVDEIHQITEEVQVKI